MSVNVLFLCLGNICRSPMAEAVFRDKVKRAGLENVFRIDSAGVGRWHIGKPPHEGTQNILERHGISSENMKARQLAEDDGAAFDYIIAMDDKNMNALFEQTHACRKKMLDFHPDRQGKDVPDPYLTGGFEEVFDLIHTSSAGLLEWIRKRENI
ncbi:low molecular weight protein-tyrosine-phosphatase [Salibacterium halotolerans]|uniref:protein-tyrosine-phosphatase n=1 Tax=Salibacterium halotolerans TaxID=1884432 RepID=A0A1I5NT89_9BACI|nr:low molecular weight protein-tyrosine-phosphatase [Salibacterium halotolerans]SFP24516.1 protein-tyrosine phosphatase [Salibacterium halotolerans]